MCPVSHAPPKLGTNIRPGPIIEGDRASQAAPERTLVRHAGSEYAEEITAKRAAIPNAQIAFVRSLAARAARLPSSSLNLQTRMITTPPLTPLYPSATYF
jgi:hypothetical protein